MQSPEKADAYQAGGREGQHAGLRAGEPGFHVSLEHGRDETADIAQCADGGDAARRRHASQVTGRQGPEQRLYGDEAGGREAERQQHRGEAVQQGRGGDAQGCHGQHAHGQRQVRRTPVRNAGDQEHHHRRAEPGHRCVQADLEADRGAEQFGDARRQVEDHAVHADLHAEVDQDESQHAAIAQHAKQVARAVVELLLVLCLHFAGECLLFFGRQPVGLHRLTLQVEQRHDAYHHGSQAFHQEHPLPVGQAEHAVHVQEPAGEGATQQQGARQAEVVDADRLAAALGWEPVGQIEDHARRETGFGQPQQKAQAVEGGFVAGEHHGGRDQAPGNHDPAEPDPGTHAVQDQVARHFEQRVTDEKDASAQGEGGVAEADIGHQGGLGEAHVGAVDHRQGEHQGEKREDAPAALADGAVDARVVIGSSCSC
ncbi:hypothetical protein D9M68_495120 [compost metagenome]